MQRQQFIALAQRLQDYAQRHPRRYHVRLVLLALLGYGFVALLTIGLLALVALLIWAAAAGAFVVALMFGIPVLALLWAAIRAFWIPSATVEGIELYPDQVPALFNMIDDVRQKLGARPVNHVLINGDLNAAAEQRPRLGVFGLYSNRLIIGLPLMLILSEGEFKSVIAHEFGHFSGEHGRLGSWLYRVRMTWWQLLQRVEGRRGIGRLIHGFAAWYGDYFAAYSFALARAYEQVADRCAGEVAGGADACRALMRMAAIGEHLNEKFWTPLFQRVNDLELPPPDTYQQMAGMLQNRVGEAYFQPVIDRLLREKTGVEDTHPCMTERLAHVSGGIAGDHPGPWLLPIEQSAATVLLTNYLPGLMRQLSDTWAEAVAPQWIVRHQYVKQQSDAAQKLDAQIAEVGEDADLLYEQASMMLDLQGPDAGLPLLRDLADRHPSHAMTRFMLGQVLLSRHDEQGVEHLTAAMQTDIFLIPSACASLYQHHKGRGDLETAEWWVQHAESHQQVLEKAQAARASLVEADVLEPHDVQDWRVKRLVAVLDAEPKVKEAHLLRKRLTIQPQPPLYVLAVTPRQRWWQMESSATNVRLSQELAAKLPLHGCLVVVLDSHWRWFRRRVRTLNEAKVYERPPKRRR